MKPELFHKMLSQSLTLFSFHYYSQFSLQAKEALMNLQQELFC